MTAKEMFKELGYSITSHEEDDLIIYCNTKFGINIDKSKVLFDKYKSNFQVIGTHRYTKNTYSHNISLELLKAITQQMKELGWLDD